MATSCSIFRPLYSAFTFLNSSFLACGGLFLFSGPDPAGSYSSEATVRSHSSAAVGFASQFSGPSLVVSSTSTTAVPALSMSPAFTVTAMLSVTAIPTCVLWVAGPARLDALAFFAFTWATTSASGPSLSTCLILSSSPSPTELPESSATLAATILFSSCLEFWRRQCWAGRGGWLELEQCINWVWCYSPVVHNLGLRGLRGRDPIL